MKELEALSPSEKEMLLKFPAYISLLAADKNLKLDEAERKNAIHFSHIKTFTSLPLLREFYREADRVFQANIAELDARLPKETAEREKVINAELARLEDILAKLGHDYAFAMHKSMKSFKDHVSHAHNNVLVNFLFPVPIKGLTD